MLYLVPTPIGNLDDITLRALRVLREVDLIACEDTRTSGQLLDHHDVDTPTTSYHEHNEREKAPELITRMRAGREIALISDAGSPGISDPGFYLARECWNEDIEVQEGFLPKKKGRQTRLTELSTELRTIVIYESPYRLLRTLDDLIEHLGADRLAAVGRELTKKYEEIERGTLEEVRAYFAGYTKVRGECVIVVRGAS
ncbi:MAG: 16S rRNA (cytidine(1402)-2'-O)-methyltransferase [Bacteroidetes bacterium SW_8_64_56]|nr:MAG: 16S rRNA (cytidine(1402)-2'-O)-methyltransferase [Bacteroidetes bacterium SW_8_64_56]